MSYALARVDPNEWPARNQPGVLGDLSPAEFVLPTHPCCANCALGRSCSPRRRCGVGLGQTPSNYDQAIAAGWVPPYPANLPPIPFTPERLNTILNLPELAPYVTPTVRYTALLNPYNPPTSSPPVVLSPTGQPPADWIEQEFIPGVKNKWLAGGTLAFIAIASLRGGKRR